MNKNRLDIASRNLVLLEKTSGLIERMCEQKIQTMLLKGAALLENIYKDISQRVMEDVDILIKPEELTKARKLLAREGYKLFGTNQANSEVYSFDAPVEIYIDLHWSLVNHKSPSQKYVYWPDENLIWERATHISLEEQTVMGMCVEDLLVYLCFHALKERFLHKKWLMDIGMVLISKREEIDWDKLTSTAADTGTDKLCCFLMEYLKKEFTIDIPASFLIQVRKKYPFYSLEKRIFHFSIRNRMFLKELPWLLAMNSRKKRLLFLKNLPAYLWKKFSGKVFISYRNEASA